MSGQRLLIVGFGAFPRVPINPSGILARRIAASPRLRRLLEVAPRCLVLRTAYAAIASDLAPALAEQPDAVLMIGVAMRAKRVRVEFRARNRATRLFPDADGRPAARLTLDPRGPMQRKSRQAVNALVVLRRSGLAPGGSRDAGAYLCNASYFRVLADDWPALFLHIPPVPDPGRRSRTGRSASRRPLDAWTDTFVDVALLLLVHARRQKRLTSFDRAPSIGEGAFRPSGGQIRE